MKISEPLSALFNITSAKKRDLSNEYIAKVCIQTEYHVTKLRNATTTTTTTTNYEKKDVSIDDLLKHGTFLLVLCDDFMVGLNVNQKLSSIDPNLGRYREKQLADRNQISDGFQRFVSEIKHFSKFNKQI